MSPNCHPLGVVRTSNRAHLTTFSR
ncbi:hypothetical protein PSCLAVI8L_150080 [Pseudoclavibacter sp. 8L]|nr:hypothetical protein PSCLAVI8L_150080 [Pseudoclavibacter sp. 8L]